MVKPEIIKKEPYIKREWPTDISPMDKIRAMKRELIKKEEPIDLGWLDYGPNQVKMAKVDDDPRWTYGRSNTQYQQS